LTTLSLAQPLHTRDLGSNKGLTTPPTIGQPAKLHKENGKQAEEDLNILKLPSNVMSYGKSTQLNLQPYTHDNACNHVDPINLVFTNASLSDIQKLFDAMNWNRNAFGKTQYLNGCSRPQDVQRDKGHFLTERYHIRIWDLGNYCVASAHFEIWYIYTHIVHHFEGAEQMIADFAESWGWQVLRDEHDLNNAEFERYNDGKATEIRKV
jgi:hypothetical protein